LNEREFGGQCFSVAERQIPTRSCACRHRLYWRFSPSACSWSSRKTEFKQTYLRHGFSPPLVIRCTLDPSPTPDDPGVGCQGGGSGVPSGWDGGPGRCPTDAGYQGLSTQTAGAVVTPRPARRRNQLPLFPVVAAAHEAERRAHASQRIRVEHGISHLKNWRALSRHLGRREHLDTMLPAVAGLVSSQERAPRPDQLHRPPRALPAGTTA
jgi:hypothetical protein